MSGNQMIEMLEVRRMLSAVSARQDGNGVVVVEGTNDSEQFRVTETAPHVVAVAIFDAAGQNVLLDQTFTCVTGVRINAKGGDDQIDFTGSTVIAVINGDDGVDTITTHDLGCSGSIIRGGNGNDQIFVDNSHSDLSGLVAGKAVTLVDGGAGDDGIQILNGSSAIVFAGSGNDGIIVEGIDATQEAHAFVDGGSGTDSLTAVFADVVYTRIETAIVVDPT